MNVFATTNMVGSVVERRFYGGHDRKVCSLTRALVALFRLGLYKVEFRILEIRISGETNLKKHFLSGNWIRKKIFWAEKTFKILDFGRKFTLNFGEDLFFFFFFFGDHLILGGKNV